MALAVLTGLGEIVGDGSHYIVASDMLSNLTSLRDAANLIDTAQFNGRVVGSTEIKLGNIVTNLLASGVLSADTTGRGKMADGFLTTAKLEDDCLSADATGRSKMEDGYLTWDKVATGSGLGDIKIGTYTGNGGSGDNAVTVATGHATDIWIASYAGNGNTFFAYPGLSSPAEVTLSGAAAYAAAIQQDANGFTILNGKGGPANQFNVTGATYRYISIALP